LIDLLGVMMEAIDKSHHFLWLDPQILAMGDSVVKANVNPRNKRSYGLCLYWFPNELKGIEQVKAVWLD